MYIKMSSCHYKQRLIFRCCPFKFQTCSSATVALKNPGLITLCLLISGPSPSCHFSQKSTALQLKSYLDKHDILEVFQSGFKTLHSSTSALIRVFKDIHLANDSGDYMILVLLDLTAVFDTVDHNIFITGLQHLVGHLW